MTKTVRPSGEHWIRSSDSTGQSNGSMAAFHTSMLLGIVYACQEAMLILDQVGRRAKAMWALLARFQGCNIWYIVIVWYFQKLFSKIGCYQNATFRIVRTKDGHDVTVRPIRLGNEGIEHLRILRKIATGPLALLSNNHTLPMAGTIDFEDVTLGIFPLTGNDMDRAFKFWPKNSVGDVVDMILQALEVSQNSDIKLSCWLT